MEEQNELMLLERVFLRLGSADTDEKLESTLHKFLCPVLLKVDSKKDAVQKKVMELLVHVNKRVKSRPNIQLPIDDLIQQYANPDTNAFTTNFTIIYIKIGFTRIESEKKVHLIPTLLNCYSGRPLPQQISILQMIMPCFQYMKPSQGNKLKPDILGLKSLPEMTSTVLQFFMDIILLPYNFTSYRVSQSANQTTPQGDRLESPFNGPPPGMSEHAYKTVTGESAPSPDELEKIKLGVIEVLGGDTFSEQEVLCHLLIGTADTRHSVASAADREMKRIVGNHDWNNPNITTKLYGLFMGTTQVKGKSVKSENKRAPASVQMRLKVFPYLLKSREACNQFPASIQVVFDCLYGANTNARLKIMAVQFVHHLCLYCPDQKLKPVAQVLLNGMTKLITESQDDAKLRSLTYVAVGKISRRVPQLVGKDIGLLQRFFDSLCKEESENRLAVQEALSLMSEAFSNIDEGGQKQVEALIMQNIEKPESQARLVAVQYAHAVFPSDHVTSRYILLLACGDQKDDVQSEATKLLRAPLNTENISSMKTGPSEPKKIKARLLPTFSDMVLYIKQKGSERIKTPNRYISGNNTLAYNPAAYSQIIIYLRLCLCYDAGITIDIESEENMQEQSPLLSSHVTELLDKEDKTDKGPVAEYIDMIRKLLNVVSDSTSLYCLLEIVAVVRHRLSPHLTQLKPWIKNMMMSSRDDIRVSGAELYALVAVFGETAGAMTEIQHLKDNLDNQAFEGQHGSLLCLGHLIGYLKSKDNVHVEEMETDQESEDDKLAVLLKETVIKMESFIENNQILLSLSSCTALGEIGRKTSLPIPTKENDAVCKYSIVQKLIDIVNSDKNHNKLRERASVTLGYLCVGESNFPFTDEVLKGLLKCAGPKQFELHMTVGEALVCAALGPNSPAARDMWITTKEQFKAPCSDDALKNVNTLLQLLLTEHVPNPNPHKKQAACVWLLAITKSCGHLSIVQEQLLQIQSAFMELLSESDEMTQDIASKGLGVVYENCGAEQKKELVSVLVETLTTGKKRTQKVTGDTKVFEEGSMGKTPDGKNLTTYRELCSIANDLNQPDLIYKFMHLANHNATWNSKKGAAFGFSTIAAQAGEQLAPYLHKIVPKMYRYQFDPNPKIQQAMASIWNALVTESKKTVDKYMKEILADLMKNLTNTQWRVRESSCIALTDLLRGRPLDDVIEYLPELWNICFRVRDDIKESVRNAADTACKALSRACIKICDPGYGKIGVHATSLVLPCLLQTGLDSQVQEVRALSLATILKISKNAGVLLKPHIPLLVYVLFESLSTLEPQYVNYISLHVASSQDTAEKLDSARVAASKTSPMMEVVNYCIPFIDETVLGELVPKLTDLIRSAIGIGTKAGVANFINSLTHQCPKLLAAHAGKLLGALLNGLNDRNVTIKKTFGSTIGHLVKVAKDSSVEKLILRLKEWYFEKEEESMRTACGTTLQAIAHRSPDVLKRHGTIALPLAFLAMHQKPKDDTESGKSNIWQEVWLETTPGTEAGIKLYLEELVTISQVALQSQSWAMKAIGASAMETIASKLGGNLGPPHLEMVLNALLSGLSGRTWTGKESLLKALSSVCVSCRDAVSKNEAPSLSSILEAMLRECKKDNMKYKIEAVKYTGEILDAHNIDKFAEVSVILFPLLEKGSSSDEDESVDRNTKLKFEEIAYTVLGQAWPTSKITQEEYCGKFHHQLCKALKSSVWKVELAVLKTYNKYLQQLVYLQCGEDYSRNPEFLTTVIHDILPLLVLSVGNIKYSSIRSEALTVLETLFEKLKGCDKLGMLLIGEEHDRLLRSLKAMSTTDSDPELCDRAHKLCKTYLSPC